MKEKLTVIKVGGKIVEEETTLSRLLADFSAIEGYKLLVEQYVTDYLSNSHENLLHTVLPVIFHN